MAAIQMLQRLHHQDSHVGYIVVSVACLRLSYDSFVAFVVLVIAEVNRASLTAPNHIPSFLDLPLEWFLLPLVAAAGMAF